MTIRDRLVHAWNAFTKQDTPNAYDGYSSSSFGSRPQYLRFSSFGEKTIIGSIYTRMAIDASAIRMLHVRLDSNDRFLETINSGLNNCLRVEANKDQTSRAFLQDVYMSMFEKGTIGIVPVDTTLDPKVTGSFDIQTMRVGEIVQWYPDKVRLLLYNDVTGNREEIVLPKSVVAIVYSPFYTVMNEPNSTLQRLIRKLALLDTVDEQSSSGKLDLIIQLPYVIKSEARKQQAENRRKDIELQLKGSQYGIAYTDGTERITQLNRPAENNLLEQVSYLTEMLYSQLGLTKGIFDGTADEKAMLNYYNKTIEPLLSAVAQSMSRTFLTKTARTQGQSIEFYRDPFKLVSVAEMADIADKFTRNEIASSNDIRTAIGWAPVKDPKADQLRNSNMPEPAASPVEVPVTQQ